MSPDFINSLFLAVAGCVVTANVVKLFRDKQVLGVYWPCSIFFALSGWQSVFFYTSLDQWHSLCGALFLALANTTWMALAAYYSMRRAW